MSQGWVIDAGADTITFYEPPANGAAIVVKEFTNGAGNSSDIWARGSWSVLHGFPSEVEFFSDRLVFSGTTAEPQTAWFSKVGNYSNFGISTPVVDDDAITATVNARQINAVLDLVPLNNLVLLTTGGEWKTSAGQDDVLTPATIAFKPQSYNGAQNLSALIIDNTAIYASRGYYIRDLSYDFNSDGYAGSDLTVFADHLVKNYTLREWDYQKVPYTAVWACRDDGLMLSMTYQREQQVVGWARHSTQGVFESVAVVSEGGQDVVYVSVARTIQGVVRRYIERMDERDWLNVREAFFVDSGLTFDGRNRAESITLSGVSFDTSANVTVTAGSAIFAATDVGDWVVLDYAGDPIRLQVIAYTSTTAVVVRPLRAVPAAYQNTPQTGWAFARDTISGLAHLEGKSVRILADGFVQGERVVTGGSIALDNPAALVHVGLGYNATAQTLDINNPGGESIRMRRKAIKKVGVLVERSRNIKIGRSLEYLEEYESRDAEDTQQPPDLLDGLVEVYDSSTYEDTGRIFIVQDNPLPVTVLGIIPDVEMGQ